jgi:hypothetical protein
MSAPRFELRLTKAAAARHGQKKALLDEPAVAPALRRWKKEALLDESATVCPPWRGGFPNNQRWHPAGNAAPCRNHERVGSDTLAALAEHVNLLR